MATRSNSDIERHYFESFREHFDLPNGEIVYTDRPDVIVRAEKSLGVEIANLYLTDGREHLSEQSQMRFRERALKLGQEIFRRHGGPPIEVTVGFDPRTPIANYRRLAESLAALVDSLSGTLTGQVPRHRFDHVPELNFLYYNSTEYADAKWRVMQCYSTPNLSVQRVGELVGQKEIKKASYQHCERYWLLLVVDFMDPAQDQEVAWPVGEKLQTSSYEKVIIYVPQFHHTLVVPQ